MRTIAEAMVKAGFEGKLELEVVKAAAEVADLEIVSIDTNLICKINNIYSGEQGYTEFVVLENNALVVAEENGYERAGIIVPVSRVKHLQKWEAEGYQRLLDR